LSYSNVFRPIYRMLVAWGGKVLPVNSVKRPNGVLVVLVILIGWIGHTGASCPAEWWQKTSKSY